MVLSGEHSGLAIFFFFFLALVIGICSKHGEIPIPNALGKVTKFAQFWDIRRELEVSNDFYRRKQETVYVTGSKQEAHRQAKPL